MTYANGKSPCICRLAGRSEGQDKETRVPPWNGSQVAQHVTSDVNDINTAYVTAF